MTILKEVFNGVLKNIQTKMTEVLSSFCSELFAFFRISSKYLVKNIVTDRERLSFKTQLKIEFLLLYKGSRRRVLVIFNNTDCMSSLKLKTGCQKYCDLNIR